GCGVARFHGARSGSNSFNGFPYGTRDFRIALVVDVAFWRVAEVNRGTASAGGFAAAESHYRPDRGDTGFWRNDFRNGAFPLRADSVTIVAGAIDAIFGKFRWGHGRIFRQVALFGQKLVNFVADFLFGFLVEQFFCSQISFIQSNGIPAFPVGAHVLGNVIGGIVLSVTHAAESLDFDKYGAFAVAGAVDRFFRGGVDSYHVVAVYRVA